MGKRGKKKDNNGGVSTSTPSSGFHTSLSIREEASGKKQSYNPKSLLKLKHLQNLAEWASGHLKDQNFDNLGTFFGHSCAEFRGSLGAPPDPSLFSCQRCETILQSGFNCTVRVEKNRGTRQRRRKPKIPAQNNVVYTCHFCSHRNIKRGTLKGYMKEIAPSRVKSSMNKSVSFGAEKVCMTEKSGANNVTTDKANTASSSLASSSVIGSITESPASTLPTTAVKLLDSKRKKKNKLKSKASADAAPISTSADIEKAGSTSKRRRKTWTTLKEIAENEERERNKRFTNFSIPFLLNST